MARFAQTKPEKYAIFEPTKMSRLRLLDKLGRPCKLLAGPDGAIAAAYRRLFQEHGHSVLDCNGSLECARCGRSGTVEGFPEQYRVVGPIAFEDCVRPDPPPGGPTR